MTGASLPRVLAVIPARGGSKGLPGKNLLPLAGLPLIGHSIRFAEMAGVTRIVVSTDDPRIAEVAAELGAVVPFLRPEELAQDDTPMAPVLTHALRQVEEQEGSAYDLLLLLDPTSPARQPADLARAVALLGRHPDCDGVVAVSEPHFNPLWVGVVEDGGVLRRAYDGGSGVVRRQDAPRFLRINGNLYLWRAAFLRDDPPVSWFDSGRYAGLEVPELQAFSIDTATELDMIQALVSSGLLELPWATP